MTAPSRMAGQHLYQTCECRRHQSMFSYTSALNTDQQVRGHNGQVYKDSRVQGDYLRVYPNLEQTERPDRDTPICTSRRGKVNIAHSVAAVKAIPEIVKGTAPAMRKSHRQCLQGGESAGRTESCNPLRKYMSRPRYDSWRLSNT